VENAFYIEGILYGAGFHLKKVVANVVFPVCPGFKYCWKFFPIVSTVLYGYPYNYKIKYSNYK